MSVIVNYFSSVLAPIRALLILGSGLFIATGALATDHNEPDLLNSFYADRNGSGSDIYGLHAYPSDDGNNLRLTLTMAPVPRTGQFEPESLQRIYLLPSTEFNPRKLENRKLKLSEEKIEKLEAELKSLQGMQIRLAEESAKEKQISPRRVQYIKSLRKKAARIQKKIQAEKKRYYVHFYPQLTANIKPILPIVGAGGNKIAFDQTKMPEIQIRYDRTGTKAKVSFRNFLLGDYTSRGRRKKLSDLNIEVPSQEATRDDLADRCVFGKQSDASEGQLYLADASQTKCPELPKKLEQNASDHIRVFAGGRDDPFFLDIGGFFRSISWLSALGNALGDDGRLIDNNFLWEGQVSYKASGAEKEGYGPKKMMLTRDGRRETMYSGFDHRLGNNINALVFDIPVKFLIPQKDIRAKRTIKTWSESYLTEHGRKKLVPGYEKDPSFTPRFYPYTYPRLNIGHSDKVDVLGIPFGDTVLNEFDTARNLGVNNLSLQDDFVLRFAHLAESHAPDFEKMGFESCYKYDPNLERSETETDNSFRDHQSGPGKLINFKSTGRVVKDFWKARQCFLQQIEIAPNSLHPSEYAKNSQLRMPRTLELFLPNLMTVHLDSSGDWPLGRRPRNQMGSRFNALFLKMGGECRGLYNIYERRKNNNWKNTKAVDPVPENEPGAKCHLQTFDTEAYSQDDPRAVIHHTYSFSSQVVEFGNGPFSLNSQLFPEPNRPAVPINPTQHMFIDPDSGEKLVGFEEEIFPYLRPTNPGMGYYQSPLLGEY